ncbi:BofC C-terminal domain-containing protein [Clostridium aminobutyricum]|uniref:Bypass of forespore C C-terminal domain-containing protein n=1 Tax=Clostridium aminobutyricum TaxID=33953 RepID=A0A939D7B6_CLOAM|nr:BofC C-terminal domain-containing protein [Clostridium aminobutyricum]MBN7772547.1 hypothetical protein [Clostridium aminobutyricum]
MFTRKKSFIKRKGFYIVIAVVLALGYLVTDWGGSVSENQEISTNLETPTDQPSTKTDQETVNNDTKQNLDSNMQNDEQKDSSSEYYLVKESDGLIKVFHYDSEGKETLLRTTDILFSLLSEEDQQMFGKGIIVNSEDELLELLQDFES